MRTKDRNLVLTSDYLLFSRRQFSQNSFVHSNAGVEILQRKVFVGGMRAAARQGQSEKQRLHSQNFSKIGDNWNATAFANQGDIGMKRLMQSALRRLPVFAIRIGQIPRTFVSSRHLQRDARR